MIVIVNARAIPFISSLFLFYSLQKKTAGILHCPSFFLFPFSASFFGDSRIKISSSPVNEALMFRNYNQWIMKFLSGANVQCTPNRYAEVPERRFLINYRENISLRTITGKGRKPLKSRYPIIAIQLLGIVLLMLGSGCHSNTANPQQLIDTYFSSAIKQDYSAAYDCYYAAYKAKVSRDEYVKHRKEASVLQSYKILSLRQDGDTAQAQVLLTFAPSEKLGRTKPAAITVTENLVREDGGWKIKVWN
jgi:hypothetical protein